MPRRAPRTPSRRSLGAAGEDAAAAALERDGWTLLERNARVRPGEIDLVLERRGVIGFVEVKARRSHRSGSPAAAVDDRKAARVARCAEAWLHARRMTSAARAFLIASVDLDADGSAVEVRILPLNP